MAGGNCVGAGSDNCQVNPQYSPNPSQTAGEPLQLSGCCSTQTHWITQSTLQRQTDVTEQHAVNFSRQVGIAVQSVLLWNQVERWITVYWAKPVGNIFCVFMLQCLEQGQKDVLLVKNKWWSLHRGLSVQDVKSAHQQTLPRINSSSSQMKRRKKTWRCREVICWAHLQSVHLNTTALRCRAEA